MLGQLSFSEPVEESYNVPLRVAVPSHASHQRPRMRQLLQLVLHAAITTSARDVIAATDRLLPVNGRVVDVSDKDGGTADVA